MPTISGRVIFDSDRSASITAGDSGLSGVPVVLQNVTRRTRITCSTDPNGNFTFINVPAGNYRLVEAYGELPGANPANFTLATSGPIPTAEDPPISIATSPPSGSTNLDSTSPNTLYLTVVASNITNQYFYDGPVVYTSMASILDSCVTVRPRNLITAAANGTFGTEAPGTPAISGPSTEPYSGIAPGFIYLPPSQFINDGYYTVANMYGGTSFWWLLTNRSTGDETGRFQMINGFNPGAIFFQQTVTVLPNTNYLFSTWIANLVKITGWANPALGVQIEDVNGNIIFNQTLGSTILPSTTVPEWKQIGTVINSTNNTQLLIKFTSQGPSANGNDYAIDDILLQQIDIPEFIPTKSVTPYYNDIGDVVTYTVQLTNTCNKPLTNVIVQDTLPSVLSFVPGSVTGGNSPGTDDPVVGFTIPNIPGGGTATVTYQATVMSLPASNPVNNTANVTYSYSPIDGGVPNVFPQVTNVNPMQVRHADLDIAKSANKTRLAVGDKLTYTLTVKNNGNAPADNVVITDALPSGTSYVPYSISANANFTGDPTTTINITQSIAAGVTVKITFQIIIDSLPTPNPISNSADVSYDYLVDPNGSSTPANDTSNTLPTLVVDPQLSVNLSSSSPTAFVGDTLTYTIDVQNTGNIELDTTVKDLLPTGAQFVPGTVQINGTSYPNLNPNSSIPLGVLNPGDTAQITFDTKVDSFPPSGTISTTATANYEYTVNSPEAPRTGSQNSPVNSVAVTGPDLRVVSSVDSSTAKIGDILTYTVDISNVGNADALNTSFINAIPPGTEFVTDSVTIDGSPSAGLDPSTGFPIGTVVAGGPSRIVTFQVRVTGNPYTPVIESTPTVDYQFNTSSGLRDGSLTGNSSYTSFPNPMFKQFNVEDIVCVLPEKPDIKTVINVVADAKILCTNVIETKTGTSPEGLVLTGFIATIDGEIIQKIEYVANDAECSTHVTEEDIPFRTYVVIPDTFDRTNTSVYGFADIEDIYYYQIDERRVFKNITLKAYVRLIS